ncbi:hypothetical protein BH18VER2_BH18VER2_05230 [soil metagenome]
MRTARASREARKWAANQANVDWLEITFSELVDDPAPAITRLTEFLGKERLPNEKGMAAVIAPTLRRRKTL